MFRWFSSLLGSRSKFRSNQKRDPERYESEKKISQSEDKAKRLTLAKNNKTHQEILYYLAENDPDPQVRQAVAKNKSMPLQASTILASDSDVDVRMTLAQRLVTLLPDLESDEQSQIYAFTVQALGTLALDEVLKIRRALSSTLKDYAKTPPKIAGQLARDVEKQVSEPILRFCAAISDEDLLDIIKHQEQDWVLEAIASRDTVAPQISEAIIATDDRKAGTALIANKGAVITQTLLQTIIEKAKDFPEWQQPSALHKNLSSEMAEELASFADSSVRDVLLRRDDFDEDTINNIATVFKRRLAYMDEESRSDETPTQRVKRLHKADRLNPETLSDAMGARDYDFIKATLAFLAKTDTDNVDRIIAMKAPKPIVALCWRAGLPMRLAFQVQQELGQVAPSELIYPKGGTDYPLSDDELIWQLEFLGLKAA